MPQELQARAIPACVDGNRVSNNSLNPRRNVLQRSADTTRATAVGIECMVVAAAEATNGEERGGECGEE